MSGSAAHNEGRDACVCVCEVGLGWSVGGDLSSMSDDVRVDQKMGPCRGSNPGPLEPKSRIIPLDHTAANTTFLTTPNNHQKQNTPHPTHNHTNQQHQPTTHSPHTHSPGTLHVSNPVDRLTRIEPLKSKHSKDYKTSQNTHKIASSVTTTVLVHIHWVYHYLDRTSTVLVQDRTSRHAIDD